MVIGVGDYNTKNYSEIVSIHFADLQIFKRLGLLTLFSKLTFKIQGSRFFRPDWMAENHG
jgi:hypothetical protein